MAEKRVGGVKAAAGFLIFFFSFVRGHGAPLLPHDFCRRLEPVTDANAFQIAALEYPGLKPEALRFLPQEAVLYYLDWASKNNVSALELFTDSVFQDPECVIYVDRQTLFKINREYELHLIAPIVGYDRQRNIFYTTYFFGGRGSILIFYNRQKTVFDHPSYNNRFELDRILRHRIARFGKLNLRGIRVLVNVIIGTLKYNIDSLTLLSGRRLEVNAEGHREINRLLPIVKRSQPTQRRIFSPAFPYFFWQRERSEGMHRPMPPPRSK